MSDRREFTITDAPGSMAPNGLPQRAAGPAADPRKSSHANLPSSSPLAAPDVERDALGCALVDGGAALTVVDMLDDEAFTDPRHKRIFAAVRQVVVDGEEPNILNVSTLVRSMENADKNAPSYVTEVSSQGTGGRDTARRLALILTEKVMARRHDGLGAWLRSESASGRDVHEIQDRLEEIALHVIPSKVGRDPTGRIGDGWETMEERFKTAERNEGLIGLPTGLTQLDTITHGWQEGHLIYVGADTNIGKTSYALQCADDLTLPAPGTTGPGEHSVAYVSTEMRKPDLLERVTCARAGVDLSKAKAGKLSAGEWADLRATRERYDRARLFVNDRRGQHVDDVAAWLTRMARFEGCKLAVIDHVQNIHGDKKRGRSEEVEQISDVLKNTAMRLDIAVLGLSQLTLPDTGDRRPRIHHLRYSKALAQDADCVATIYRPERYGIEYSEDFNRPTRGLAEWIIDKQRGEKSDFSFGCTWREGRARFADGLPSKTLGETPRREDAPF